MGTPSQKPPTLKLVETPPQPTVEKSAETPPLREDVTLTLFDALQAARPHHKKDLSPSAKPTPTYQIVGGIEPSFDIKSVSPKLWVALGLTVVAVFGFYRLTQKPSAPEPAVAKGANPSANLGTAPALKSQPAPLPTTAAATPQFGVQRPAAAPLQLNQRNWANPPATAQAGTSQLSDKEREREKDLEYEREREREMRRRLESWRSGPSAQQPTTRIREGGLVRPSEDPDLIEGARGYRDPGAVLRDRDRQVQGNSGLGALD